MMKRKNYSAILRCHNVALWSIYIGFEITGQSKKFTLNFKGEKDDVSRLSDDGSF